MEATLTRRRHTREFDGNIGGTETTIPFFHFFFCFFFFFFSLFFSFRPKRDRRTIIIYSFGRRWYLTLYPYLNRLSENRGTISWAANIRNKWASIQSARHVFVARRYWGNSNRFRPIGTSNRGKNYRSISNFISFSSRSVPRQRTHGSRRVESQICRLNHDRRTISRVDFIKHDINWTKNIVLVSREYINLRSSCKDNRNLM